MCLHAVPSARTEYAKTLPCVRLMNTSLQHPLNYQTAVAPPEQRALTISLSPMQMIRLLIRYALRQLLAPSLNMKARRLLTVVIENVRAFQIVITELWAANSRRYHRPELLIESANLSPSVMLVVTSTKFRNPLLIAIVSVQHVHQQPLLQLFLQSLHLHLRRPFPQLGHQRRHQPRRQLQRQLQHQHHSRVQMQLKEKRRLMLTVEEATVHRAKLVSNVYQDQIALPAHVNREFA